MKSQSLMGIGLEIGSGWKSQTGWSTMNVMSMCHPLDRGRGNETRSGVGGCRSDLMSEFEQDKLCFRKTTDSSLVVDWWRPLFVVLQSCRKIFDNMMVHLGWCNESKTCIKEWVELLVGFPAVVAFGQVRQVLWLLLLLECVRGPAIRWQGRRLWGLNPSN